MFAQYFVAPIDFDHSAHLHRRIYIEFRSADDADRGIRPLLVLFIGRSRHLKASRRFQGGTQADQRGKADAG